jgi:hypothetical protein
VRIGVASFPVAPDPAIAPTLASPRPPSEAFPRRLSHPIAATTVEPVSRTQSPASTAPVLEGMAARDAIGRQAAAGPRRGGTLALIAAVSIPALVGGVFAAKHIGSATAGSSSAPVETPVTARNSIAAQGPSSPSPTASADTTDLARVDPPAASSAEPGASTTPPVPEVHPAHASGSVALQAPRHDARPLPIAPSAPSAIPPAPKAPDTHPPAPSAQGDIDPFSRLKPK